MNQPASILFTPATKRRLIIIAVNILVFIGLLLYLPFDTKANMGLALLAFIGVLWLTEVIHITFTALLVPVLAVGMGLLKTDDALKTFADPIIFLFFGGFALATALNIQKLDKLIANRILMMAKGNLLLAALLLFGITAVLSMWISNTATTAMMLPLVMGILSKMDRTKERNTYVFMLLGVAYSASIGGLGTLVGSPPNAIAAANLGLDFWGWMKIGLPMMIVLLPLMFGVLYLVFKPKLNQTMKLELEAMEWTPTRYMTIAIFGLTVFCWIFSTKLSAFFGGIKGFDSIVAISAAILIGITGIATWRQIQTNTEWGVLMLFGGGLTLSTILKESGASLVMAKGVADIFGDGHWFFIVLAVTVLIIFLTEFTSNTASAALLVPIFGSVAQALNMPPLLLVAIIGIGASCAFMLPVATPPNAIVYGTGHIKQSEMMRAGMWLNVVCIIAISCFAWFFWQ